MKPDWLEKLPMANIERVANNAGIDPKLIASIVMVESAGNTYAVRYESTYKYILNPAEYSSVVGTSLATETMFQASSWGLMQIMGGTARADGYRDCFPKLCDPDTGLLWGCLHFAKLLKKYPDLPDAIAAYNAGKPIKDRLGNYVNSVYVQKVLGHLAELK